LLLPDSTAKCPIELVKSLAAAGNAISEAILLRLTAT
jgi:hypothetical protein